MFTLSFRAAEFDPAVSTEYYIGPDPSLQPQLSVNDSGVFYVMRPGRIVSADVRILRVATGTDPGASAGLVLVEVGRETSDGYTSIGSQHLTAGVAPKENVFVDLGLSLTTVGWHVDDSPFGENVALRITTPAWATPPTKLVITGTVYIEDEAEQAAFDDHSARHEAGGADEISLQVLNGTSTQLQAHLDDATAAHAASAIAVTPAGDLAADDVQEALVELQGDIDTAEAAIVTAQAAADEADDTADEAKAFADQAILDAATAQGTADTAQENVDNHIADAVGAHAASAISNVPAGSVAATDLQAAIDEIAVEQEESADITALDARVDVLEAGGPGTPTLTAEEARGLRSNYNLKAADEIGPLLTAHGGS